MFLLIVILIVAIRYSFLGRMMKVFLSWSGEKSHKVALVFRDWFPSVIQSLEPYVSSEDIDKGTRWSTDIAKELEDSTFGILCVTKENLTAPWLTFEAGALSKTMDKSFVSPFLFDIKRSEVDGPILQFQSTIFNKTDVNKLIKTLNKACGEDQLTSERLDKAFNVWWPTLKAELDKLKSVESEAEDEQQTSGLGGTNEILEEILDLSRINQKLLRNPDNSMFDALESLQHMLHSESVNLKNDSRNGSQSGKKIHPFVFEQLMELSPHLKYNYFAIQIVISLIRDDFPWLYESGMEIVVKLKSKAPKNEIRKAVEEFEYLIDFTFEHPAMHKIINHDKRQSIILRELPFMIRKSLSIN